MLFRKDMEPRCCYCQHGTIIGEDRITCLKKGVVSPDFQCRAFQYDPLQRTPPQVAQLDFSNLKEEDFTI